jgi:calcineurin-like phosphoesterase
VKGLGPEAERSRRERKYFFKKAKKYLLVKKKEVLLRPLNEGKEVRGKGKDVLN